MHNAYCNDSADLLVQDIFLSIKVTIKSKVNPKEAAFSIIKIF